MRRIGLSEKPSLIAVFQGSKMGTALSRPRQIADPRLSAEKLEAYFKVRQLAIIAYSGGVDNALLAYAAHRALREASE